MQLEHWLALVATSVPVWPTLAFLVLGGWMLLGRAPAERSVRRIVSVAQVLSLLAAAVVVAGMFALGLPSLEVSLGHWFDAGPNPFSVTLFYDWLSAPMALVVTLISAAIGRFSANYLHREAGFARFYLMLLLFSSGMISLVIAGSYDHLFIGWELVGITSVLLVAFFWDRAAPVRSSLRLLITYRLCDVALLFGAVMLHEFSHGPMYPLLYGHGGWLSQPAELAAGPATLIGVLMLVAAMGKSAQFPLGNWLPRAMEGPSPSSALFYGGLSVHAGVYLLLRSAPILEQAPWARAAIFFVGAFTAAQGALVARVQTDAKNGLAYSTMTQVGLMFVSVGLGWYWLAFAHLVGHAFLRTFQLLRAPSALADAQAIRAGLVGRAVQRGAQRGVEPLAPSQGLRERLWFLAHVRFNLDGLLERWLLRPVVAAASALETVEMRWAGLLSGWHTVPGSAPSRPSASPAEPSAAVPPEPAGTKGLAATRGGH
jgi:NADH:ubiquinone oxidoreductase subunit 5 (subunit L)/multisubunit Na+/H+ antiporter MnhA subunit